MLQACVRTAACVFLLSFHAPQRRPLPHRHLSLPPRSSPLSVAAVRSSCSHHRHCGHRSRCHCSPLQRAGLVVGDIFKIVRALRGFHSDGGGGGGASSQPQGKAARGSRNQPTMRCGLIVYSTTVLIVTLTILSFYLPAMIYHVRSTNHRMTRSTTYSTTLHGHYSLPAALGGLPAGGAMPAPRGPSGALGRGPPRGSRGGCARPARDGRRRARDDGDCEPAAALHDAVGDAAEMQPRCSRDAAEMQPLPFTPRRGGRSLIEGLCLVLAWIPPKSCSEPSPQARRLDHGARAAQQADVRRCLGRVHTGPSHSHTAAAGTRRCTTTRLGGAPSSCRRGTSRRLWPLASGL